MPLHRPGNAFESAFRVRLEPWRFDVVVEFFDEKRAVWKNLQDVPRHVTAIGAEWPRCGRADPEFPGSAALCPNPRERFASCSCSSHLGSKRRRWSSAR
jgi:hypothetical protein